MVEHSALEMGLKSVAQKDSYLAWSLVVVKVEAMVELKGQL